MLAVVLHVVEQPKNAEVLLLHHMALRPPIGGSKDSWTSETVFEVNRKDQFSSGNNGD